MSEECNLGSLAEENLEIDSEAIVEEESTEIAPIDHVPTAEEGFEGDRQTTGHEQPISPTKSPLNDLLESSTLKLKQINLNEGDESLSIQEGVSEVGKVTEHSSTNANIDRSPTKPSSSKMPSDLGPSPTKPLSPSKEVPTSGRSPSKSSKVLSPKTPGEQEAPSESVQKTDKTKDPPSSLTDTPETPASSSRRRGRKPGQTPRAKSTPSRQPALTSPPLTRSRSKELGKMQFTPRALEERRKN